MATTAIDILIQSRNEAIRDLRSLRAELGGLRQDFPSIAGAAAELEQSLGGVAEGFVEVFRAGQAQGVDLSETFEGIARGGEEGEAALREFAQIAGELAPQAAQQLAQDIGTAASALTSLVESEAATIEGAQGIAQGLGGASAAAKDLAAASAQSAAAQHGEADAARQATVSAETKGRAEEEAARRTRQHEQASKDLEGALRGAHRGLDAVTQQLNQMVPGLNSALAPVQGLERALGGLGPAGLALGLIATAATAVGGAALFMGKSLADDIEHLENIRRSTGASLENLQVFRRLLTEAGLSADAATFPLINMNRAIAQGDPLLSALGISARDPVEALIQLSRVLALSRDEQAKTEVTLQLLGGRQRELLAVTTQLAEEFPQLRDAMKETSALIDGTVVKSATDLDDQLDELSRNWAGLWNDMRAAAVPAASDIVKGIQEILNAAREVPETPLFKWIVDQSRQAKEDFNKESDELIARVLANQKRVGPGLDEAAMERIRSFPLRPPRPTLPIAQEGDPGFVGPTIPKDVQEDILARAQREAAAHALAQEAAKKRADQLRQLAEVLRGTGADAAAALAEMERTERADRLAAVLDEVTRAGVAASAALDFQDLGGRAGEEFAELEGRLGGLNEEIAQLARASSLPPSFVRGLVESKDQAGALAKALESIGVDLPADFVPDLEAARGEMESLAEAVEALSAQRRALEAFNREAAELAAITGLDPDVVQSLLKAEEQADATAAAFRRLGLEQPVTPEQRREERREERRQRREQQVQERTEILHDPEQVENARKDFQLLLEEITAAGNQTTEILSGTFNALQSGLAGVFQSTLAGANAFRQSLVNLFRQMVNELLAQLARLAASEIFKIFLQMIGVPAIVTTAVSASTAAGTGAPGGGVGPRTPPPPVPGQVRASRTEDEMLVLTREMDRSLEALVREVEGAGDPGFVPPQPVTARAPVPVEVTQSRAVTPAAPVPVSSVQVRQDRQEGPRAIAPALTPPQAPAAQPSFAREIIAGLTSVLSTLSQPQRQAGPAVSLPAAPPQAQAVPVTRQAPPAAPAAPAPQPLGREVAADLSGTIAAGLQGLQPRAVAPSPAAAAVATPVVIRQIEAPQALRTAPASAPPPAAPPAQAPAVASFAREVAADLSEAISVALRPLQRAIAPSPVAAAVSTAPPLALVPRPSAAREPERQAPVPPPPSIVRDVLSTLTGGLAPSLAQAVTRALAPLSVPAAAFPTASLRPALAAPPAALQFREAASPQASANDRQLRDLTRAVDDLGRRVSAMPRGEQHVHVSAIDVRSLVDSIESPFGAMRQAFEQAS